MENNFEHITLAIALMLFAVWLIIIFVLQFEYRRSNELQLGRKPKRELKRLDDPRDFDLRDVTSYYYHKQMERDPYLSI